MGPYTSLFFYAYEDEDHLWLEDLAHYLVKFHHRIDYSLPGPPQEGECLLAWEAVEALRAYEGVDLLVAFLLLISLEADCYPYLDPLVNLYRKTYLEVLHGPGGKGSPRLWLPHSLYLTDEECHDLPYIERPLIMLQFTSQEEAKEQVEAFKALLPDQERSDYLKSILRYNIPWEYKPLREWLLSLDESEAREVLALTRTHAVERMWTESDHEEYEAYLQGLRYSIESRGEREAYLEERLQAQEEEVREKWEKWVKGDFSHTSKLLVHAAFTRGKPEAGWRYFREFLFLFPTSLTSVLYGDRLMTLLGEDLALEVLEDLKEDCYQMGWTSWEGGEVRLSHSWWRDYLQALEDSGPMPLEWLKSLRPW